MSLVEVAAAAIIGSALVGVVAAFVAMGMADQYHVRRSYPRGEVDE